jgi:hypothetical protein
MTEQCEARECNETEEYDTVLVIRSRCDNPVPVVAAVRAWAAERAYHQHRFPIVIAASDKTVGPLVWNWAKPEEGVPFRDELASISARYDVPVYLFDQVPRERFYTGLLRALPDPANSWAKGIREQRPDSYGAGSNEGLMWANVLGAKQVLFVDDDTRPVTEIDILQKHLDLREARDAVAVTGGYIGAHWMDVSFLPERGQQDRWVSLLVGQIPEGKSVQDSIPFGTPPREERCRWLIAGNCLLHEEFFSRACCPILTDTVATDDILLGLIGSRAFRTARGSSRLWKSDLPVIHAQDVSRATLGWIGGYLRRWARAVGFFAMMGEEQVEGLAEIVSRRGSAPVAAPDRALGQAAVENFGRELERMANALGGELGQAMAAVAQEAQGANNQFVDKAWQGIVDYAELLKVWPAILQAIADDPDLRAKARTDARC